MTLRLALAQRNMRVGDIEGNAKMILADLERARELGVDIIAFPEMAVTGYPPEDLLMKPDFLGAAMRAMDTVCQATRGLTAVIGTVYAEGDLYNAAAVCHDGRLAAVYRKQCLPNYGVFDENRYFRTGWQQQVFHRDGHLFGVSICEDIWYPDGPPAIQSFRGGAELLLNISASPYYVGRGRQREAMIATRALDTISFVAYCNLVGGQDELVFDGQSLICGPDGEVLARGRQFEEELVVADLDVSSVFLRRLYDPRRRRYETAPESGIQHCDLQGVTQTQARPALPVCRATPLDRVAEVYNALVLGTRDYVAKNGFRQVVLGLSGGIDSALTATVAADALGPENVTGVAMPTRYSSSHSIEDAEALAKNLGIRLLLIPIDRSFQSYLDALAPVFEQRPEDLTEENIQPRIRGTILMALSNKFGSLVLTTGNKSEVGVGYSTLYGDTAGGFAVIKDVNKLLVYELARYRNQLGRAPVVPERTLTKPPSAELRPDQKDSDSIPEYNILDPLLQAYIEEGCSPEEIVARGFDANAVRRVVALVDRNEYKRRQSPPGVKITQRAFGKDWRLPITNGYRGFSSAHRA